MNNSVVSSPLGKLEGVEKEQVFTFRGVPFAQSLEGDLRFRRPQPIAPWQGTFECNRFAPAAWQEKNPLMGIDAQSLDCLRLNIWVPKGKGPFPVMVWLHGGGYLTGSPSQLLYSGEKLAAQQQVIVVNVAYRLGAMGFGDFREWIPDADTNLGMRDQIAALEWVQTHIASFGGNPDAVTLFGESAGGFSVACLMACEQASGLFHRGIVQSGAGDMVVSSSESQRMTTAFVNKLGENKLLDSTRDEWVKAQRVSYRMTVKRGLRDSTPQYGMSWLPQVEGDLLTDLPVNCIAAGSAKDKLMLAGVCRDEWRLFQFAPPFNGNKPPEQMKACDTDEVQRRFARALPVASQAQDAFELYQQTPFHPELGRLDWLAALETDRLFIVPTQRLLDAQQQAGGDAYGYLFTHETEMFGIPMGSCHVSDIPFVFDLLDKPVGQLFAGSGAAAEDLSRQVQATWGDIAKGEKPDWPAWQFGSAGLARVFGPGAQQQPLLNVSKLAFWGKIIPAAEKNAVSA